MEIIKIKNKLQFCEHFLHYITILKIDYIYYNYIKKIVLKIYFDIYNLYDSLTLTLI